MHCIKLLTATSSEETQADELHVIEVMVRYNNGIKTTFTWKGRKHSGYKKEMCQPHELSSALTYVQDVWIRQLGSNNTWFAKSVLVQESVESPSYVQYGLIPPIFEFWTDGYRLYFYFYMSYLYQL